jgi:hypothetical protein
MRRLERWLWLAAAAMLAAGVGAGCGAKSRPIPPSQTHPERVNDLSAKPDPKGVRLTWSRPMKYTGGKQLRDLAGFRLMRAEGAASFSELAELPVTDQERFQKVRRFTYIDRSAAMGHAYRYIIIAETTDGYQSDPSNIARLTRTPPAPPPSPESFVLPTPAPLPQIPATAPTP